LEEINYTYALHVHVQGISAVRVWAYHALTKTVWKHHVSCRLYLTGT